MNGDLNNSGVKSPKLANRTQFKGRMQVALLDDTVVAFDVEPKSKGEELYKKVNTHLNLDEAEYFGLLFTDEDENQSWLDHLKPIIKQVKEPSKVTFKFRVMFYTPDPNGLQEYTRYLFTLQVRRDLLDGRLHCSEDTGALLASYIVQGELGDHDPMVHKVGYLAGFQFVPNQTPNIEQKIVDYHRSHRGESPSESDHNMLEIARKLEMYGVTLYPAQDSDGVHLNLAVFSMGVLVFQDKHKINSFSWANIRKLTFKKKKFLVKLHQGKSEDGMICAFEMKSRDAAKGFWKVCVNHHVFFRQKSANTLKRGKGRTSFKRGSKYRYSGRTQREISEEASTRFRAPSDMDNDKNGYMEKNKFQTPSVSSVPDSPYNTGPLRYNSLQASEDEGSFSVSSDAYGYRKDEHRADLEEDNIIAPSTNKQNVITITHQDTLDSIGNDSFLQAEQTVLPPSYYDIMIEEPAVEQTSQDVESSPISPVFEFDDSSYKIDSTLQPEYTSSKLEDTSFQLDEPTNNFDTSITNGISDGDDLSLDATVHVTSTDREIEDEVESMFQRINSEYGGITSGWQYNISSVTTEQLKSDDEKEQSDTEDEIPAALLPDVSESTEVDADEARKMEVIQVDAGEQQSDKTEADEETEAQLREKVKALYLQTCPTTQSYDSDSDASAITVDDEGSAFEDDLSLPRSSSSSVSSIHKLEGYLRKFKTSSLIYSIAKEILLTERTYVKDLEVLTVSFRSIVEKDGVMSDYLLKLLYDNIDPLYDFHCSLLAELEERINLWENITTAESTRDCVQKIGDIMHRNMRQIKLYTSYIKRHADILIELEAEAKRSKEFEKVYKEFELGKVCYLSLNSFLLKPVQRLLYYRSMLERLTKEYGNDHPDAIDAKVAYEEVVEACKNVESSMLNLENLHKMVELERDMVGIEDLVHPKRIFIREGCLHKICRKGPQPRMFFLLSDMLLYTSQGVTATNQFRARAQIPLRSLKIEEGGVELHGLYAFTIVGPGTKSFVVAASSPEERSKWIDDMRKAIDEAIQTAICSRCQSNKTEFMLYVGQDNSHMCSVCKADMSKLGCMSPDERLKYWQSNYPPLPLIKRSSADADSDDEGAYSLSEQYSSLDRRHARSRTISTRKVCWHRNASISMKEYTMSIQNSLSGTLLRKFKNTSKWQKLWVVFTNFCLYFFKSYEDEAPLASLPLIGYNISRPTELDVHEELAFKLQFKTHVYFFRAETEYAFERWMDVIMSATKSGSRSRIQSRRNGSTG